MGQKKRTLSFLANNYHPFTRFSIDMLNHAGEALRIFELKAGERITIRSSGAEDQVFVTEGTANFSSDDIRLERNFEQTDQQPILFKDILEVSTDTEATVCHVDTALINEYLSLKDISDSAGLDDNKAFTERLMFLKSTQAFRLLPVNAVEEAANRCEEVKVDAGDVIIKQDTRADDFYILLEGEAEVWREELEDDVPRMVALLGSGATFGEEALIIGGARNATIQMISEGTLLKLSKEDFDELVSLPALRSVTPDVAKVMADNGAIILDVRYEEEYEQQFIPGSILIPLPDLRNHIDTLDKEKEYLVLCAAGLRAAAATLLLRQQDINAVFIEGGIKAWPFDTAKEMDLELILFDFCPFAQRAVISLQHNDIPHKLTYLDLENLPDWFAEVSPFGKVPILRVDGKTTIFESAVINELIASVFENKMLPTDPVDRSLCRSWIEFGSTLLEELTGIVMAGDEEKYTAAHKTFLQNLQRLEEQLENRGPYFTGNAFSLVDSTYAPLFMRMAYLNTRTDLYDPEQFPKVQAWADLLLSLDSVKSSVPDAFGSIYQCFIERRGKDGYLLPRLQDQEQVA